MEAIACLVTGSLSFPAPGWRHAALMILPPFSGPAVEPIRHN